MARPPSSLRVGVTIRDTTLRPARHAPVRAVVPQISDNVRRVSEVVLVRWASLTAFAHGPSASNRQSSPPRSIVCLEALKTYDAPAGATPTRNGPRARSRSTTLIGKPLCRDTTLHASTATLIDESVSSRTALSRYSEAGLLRPVGLKPPFRNSTRTASRTTSSACKGAAASRAKRARNSRGAGV